MDVLRRLGAQVGRGGWRYAAVVAALTALGAALQSPWPLLAAAVVTLPSSLIALPTYYLAYGLLAVVSGANPSTATGSGSGTPGGVSTTSESAGTALWFVLVTDLVLVLLLVAAAVLNVLLYQRIRERRRRWVAAAAARRGDPGPTPEG